MSKRKLFAICLTIVLMSSGCAESKSIGESSETSNTDVEIGTSGIFDAKGESKIESKDKEDSIVHLKSLEISEMSKVESKIVEESNIQVITSESAMISDQTKESEHTEESIVVSSEVVEHDISDTASYIEVSTAEMSDMCEQTNEDKMTETHEVAWEYSTIPNDQANVRYSPPPESSSNEKWVSEMDGAEDSEEEIQIWAITQCECVTCDGDIIEEGTYVRILENFDIDDEYCVIQWYDAEANISEHGLAMFEIWESDTYDIIAHKTTAGIITP